MNPDHQNYSLMSYVKFIALFIFILTCRISSLAQTNMFLGTATHMPVKKNVRCRCLPYSLVSTVQSLIIYVDCCAITPTTICRKTDLVGLYIPETN